MDIQHRNPVATTDSDRLHSLIRALHADPAKTIVYHNAAFDLGVLISQGWLREEQIQCRIFDTMRASYILDPVKAKEGGKHSLKVLYDELLRGEHGPRQPDCLTWYCVLRPVAWGRPICPVLYGIELC